MAATMKLLALSAAVGVALAQTPERCTYPQAFTASAHTFFYQKNVMARGAVSADQVNQRYFTQYSGVEKGQRFSVDEITLFKEDRHYTIMGGAAGSKPTCHYETIPAHKAFHPFGIPPNATFHGQISSGLPPHTQLINEFGSHMQEGNAYMDTWHHVTAEGCMPTSTRRFMVTANGTHDVDNSMFEEIFDVVLGISDPNVFIPPAGCTAKPHPSPPHPSPPAPPHTVCRPTIERECGTLEHKGATCVACTKKNAATLAKAGCTAAMEAAFCFDDPPIPPAPPAPPHTVCRPTIERECGTLEGKGAPCLACTKNHTATLAKAGCTAAIEAEFCKPTHSMCTATIEHECGTFEHKGADCRGCTKTHESTLAKAGCTAAQEEAFCAANPPAPPHSVCYPMMEKVCGPEEHKGVKCTECLQKNAVAVEKAGCTDSMTTHFCAA